MANIFISRLLKTSSKGFIRKPSLNRTLHVSVNNMVKVGDKIPSVDLYENTPGNVVNIAEFCSGRKIVMFGVPGAFTPGCSRTHLPGFVHKSAEIKKRGVDEIVCVSVNDPFVMDAWGKNHDATGKIRMFADPNAEFAKLTNLDIDLPKLGGIRLKRFSLIAEDGIITVLNIEADGTGLFCSLANKIITQTGS